MVDRTIEEVLHGRRGGCRRQAIDGLVIDDRWVWLVLGDENVDTVALLFGDPDGGESGVETRICRRLEGDSVIIGAPDPEHDRFLSQLLAEDDPEHG